MVLQIRKRKDPSPGRRGITLFEVVLALAIFVGAFAAISQILRTGSRSAIRAQLTSEAVLRCERRMNEVLAGVLPLQTAQRVPFEDNSAWLWSVNVMDAGTPNLLQVETLVERIGTGSDSSASFRMIRLIRDPQIYYDAALQSTGEVL